MDILKVLLNFLLGENAQQFAPIVDSLKENSFDLVKTLSALDINAVAPIVKSFLSQKENPSPVYQTNDGVSEIKKIADEEIVATLNRYFSSEFNI